MTDKVTTDDCHDERRPDLDTADQDATLVAQEPEAPATAEHDLAVATADELGDAAQQDQPAEVSSAVLAQGSPMPEVPDLLARIAGRIAGNERNGLAGEQAAQARPENEANQEENAADDMRQRLRQLQEQAEASRTEARQGSESPFANAEAALMKLSQQVEEQEDFGPEAPVMPVTSEADADVVAGSPESPWNEDAAETLTTHYEAAGLTCTEKQDDLLIGAPAASETDAPVSYVYMQPNAPEAGPQWFAQRFDEMSKRLDAVAGERSQQSGSGLAALVERFDALELCISELLDQTTSEGVAGAAPANGSLHDIELCIAEIAGQLEAATAELARIEGIEQKLAEVATSISERRGMVSTTVDGDAPSPFDMAALADLVANKVAAKPMPLMADDSGDATAVSGGISELSATMKEFVRERRSEGEHTNAVLDTMQQTIIRVLDRMEALEASAPRSAAGLPQSPAQPATSAAPSAEVIETPSPTASDVPVYADPPPATSPTSKTVAASVEEPAPAEPEDAANPESVSLERLQRVMGQLEGRDKASAEKPKAAGPSAARGGGGGIARDRANLVKAARQAAAKADQSVESSPIDKSDSDRARFAAAARQAAANANKRLINDDTAEEEIDATHDGFSLSSLGARLGSVTGSKKKQTAKSRARTRLVVAALAIVAVGLGATKYMISTSSKPAPHQLQSSHAQEDTKVAARNVPASTVKVSMPARENGAAAFAQRVGAGEASYAAEKDAVVQPASVPPEATIGPVSGAPGSISRKALPSALVGPLSMRLAAANGDPSAEFQVATRYADGKGVKQDLEEALKWYRRSASRGFALSQYRLATFYERGLSVTKDVQRARVWYQRAASLGNVKAMHNLAVLSAGSSAGKPDYETAAKWFTAAAERGLGDSQFNLAILYRNGLGVPQDEEKAYTWFSRAGSAGDKEALRRMKEVEVTLGKDRVARLRSEMRRWTRKSTSKMANDPHYAGQAWQRKSTNNS